MKKEIPERKRAFLRWLTKGSKERETQARHALTTFLPPLLQAGFEWVEKDFEGYNSQVNSISLERGDSQGNIDFISIIFDKHRKPKFKIVAGTKKLNPPYEWIKAGDIVRYRSETDQAKWWAPKFWQPNKKAVFNANVAKVAALLPQLIRFLDTGEVGSHIWEHKIPS